MATTTDGQPASIEQTSVLIAGGGPVGLTLALELQHHGVDAIVVERNPETTRHPKMDITNGRSMELFRRLGVADELRAVAVAEDHPFDVSWVTSLAGWELARFVYPTVEQRRAQIRERNDGTQPLEPAMRVSQVVIEPALKGLLEERAQHIDLRFGWALDSFHPRQRGRGRGHPVRRNRSDPPDPRGISRRLRRRRQCGPPGSGYRTGRHRSAPTCRERTRDRPARADTDPGLPAGPRDTGPCRLRPTYLNRENSGNALPRSIAA